MIRATVRRGVLAGTAMFTALACTAPATHAAFDIKDFSTSLNQAAQTNSPLLTAGAHPDFNATIELPFKLDDDGSEVPDGTARQLDVRLPQGLTANPTVASTCTQDDLTKTFAAACAVDSQIGLARVAFSPGTQDNPTVYPLYNIEAPPGAPARLGFNIFGVPVIIDATVRTGTDYALQAGSKNISQGLSLSQVSITLWGVPADPVHDAERSDSTTGADYAPPASSSLPKRAFVNNPTSCAGPQTFGLTGFSWQNPNTLLSRTDGNEPGGSPFSFTGCADLPFDPSVTVQPTTTAPDSPTGVDVSVKVPQSSSPDLPATSHLRDLTLTLPPGMGVNPSAANGLGACSPAQIALNSGATPTCPDSAKLGTVSITSPLLRQPLSGGVYLATQNDNPFGSLLSLYLVAEGQGVVIKLAGKIETDPATGQVTVSFRDNPQLPFSQLDVHLDGGPGAPLTTPATCGTQNVAASIAPWSGGAAVSASDSFSIDCSSGLGAFSPGFDAGTSSPTAALSSPLLVNVDRPDGQSPLNRLSLRLPTGLLASLRGVRQCASAQADAGTCDALSRVGGATVVAGAGPTPFSLPGDVYLTGPYKGAPFGLAVKVRALAGPLDLGTVIVRQALFIDPEDTHVTVVSDSLPTILQGVPIRLRSLRVNVDRPGFALNPTSCAAKRVRGNLGAVSGANASLAVRFQVGNCGALDLEPKLALRLLGKGSSLRDGGHPAVKAILTQPGGQSNLKRAEVKLPLSLALDPDNAQTLCEYADGKRSTPTCPKGSIVGTAKARTPLLARTLSGPVYFVKGQRTDRRTGRVIKTLPTLVVPLSGEGVRINLRAKTAVSGGRLVATFDPIPDAPVSRFDLSLAGGTHGILVANTDVCDKPRQIGVGIRGQNGELARSTRDLAASCR